MADVDVLIAKSSVGQALATQGRWRELGLRLRNARTGARLSRGHVADLANLTLSIVLDMELGMCRPDPNDDGIFIGPTNAELSAFATAVGVTATPWLVIAAEIRKAGAEPKGNAHG